MPGRVRQIRYFQDHKRCGLSAASRSLPQAAPPPSPAVGSSAFVRGLREERRQDLLDVPAPAARALRGLAPVLREGLDTIENMLALTTTIFVRRHGTSIRDPNAGGFSSARLRGCHAKLWQWPSGVHHVIRRPMAVPEMKERVTLPIP